MAPRIRYARTADLVDIAFWTHGSGPPLLVLPAFFNHHLEQEWQWEPRRRCYEALATCFTVVRFDSRSLGLSQRDVSDLSPDALLGDIEAVLSSLGIESGLHVLVEGVATPLAAHLAATHPKLVTRLVMWEGMTALSAVFEDPRLRALLPLMEESWRLYILTMDSLRRGWSNAEAARDWADVAWAASSPDYPSRLVDAWRSFDGLTRLSSIECPTLVMMRDACSENVRRQSRLLASAVPGAKLRVINDVAGTAFLDGGDDLGAALEFLQDDSASSQRKAELTPALSQREQEVYEFLISPLTAKHIAERMGISIFTLDRHIVAIYRKLGVHSRMEIMLRGTMNFQRSP